MRNKWRVLLVLISVLFSLGAVPTRVQAMDTKYFPETRHNVSGEFLAFYNSVPDPLLVFGYPKTEAFFDRNLTFTIQYFQRARFELHPDAQAGQRVQLSMLAKLVYSEAKTQPVVMVTNSSVCRNFPSAGKTFAVCYAFLAFFDTHGGLDQFGSPISNYVTEGDRYVQYFERARFEWHPELSPDQWVRLAEIGMIQFSESKRDPSLLVPVDNKDFVPVKITSLQARAFVARAVTSPNSQQTIFVVVEDSSLVPVAQASVTVTIRLPSGEEQRIGLPPSDENGISQYTFNVGDQPTNQIATIKVEAMQGELKASTATWFRTWY
jgi:hypothetical protein